MKELWILLGFITMTLGIIGIVLPILPTTPFFLVTAYAFNKGSKRFSNWFLKHTIVQKYVADLQMTKMKKWVLNISVDGVLMVYFFIVDVMIIRILLILLIISKHYVFHKYIPIKQ
jgi:uncharacterized membrane protein YbaN (DUF454 family)